MLCIMAVSDFKDKFAGDETRSRHSVVDADQMPGFMCVVDQREGYVGDETHSLRSVLALKCILVPG